MVDWEAYTETGLLHAAQDVERVDNGIIKETYRVTDADGTNHVLQTADRGEEWRLHKQRAVYDRLADTPVPVPAVLHDASATPPAYQAVEHLPGTDLHDGYDDLPTDMLQRYARDAGRYLGLAHDALTMDGYGFPAADAAGLHVDGDDWPGFFAAFIEGQRDIVADGPFDRDGLAADLQGTLDTLTETYPADPPARLCHLDYAPSNLKGVDGDVTAVLDWDNAFAGDPLFDYVDAEQAFTAPLDDDTRRETVRDAFRDGYETAAGHLLDDDMDDVYRFCATVMGAAKWTYAADTDAFTIDDATADLFVDSLQEQMAALDER